MRKIRSGKRWKKSSSVMVHRRWEDILLIWRLAFFID